MRLDDVKHIRPGDNISGSGICAGTTVVAVDAKKNELTLVLNAAPAALVFVLRNLQLPLFRTNPQSCVSYIFFMYVPRVFGAELGDWCV